MQNYPFPDLLLSDSVSKIDNDNLRLRSNQLLVTLYKEIIILLHPNVFLEIGAREADFSFLMSHVLSNTEFICYEANKHSFDAFSGRFKFRSNVKYLNIAVSNSSGSVTVKIPNGNRPEVLTKGHTSLLHRTNYSKGYVEEIVNCTTLDESCLSISADSSICAWIDVEGHFRAVHSGGPATFARLDALFVEVEDYSFWEGQALTPEVCSTLRGCGMIPIARDRESDLQYNVIFIKENLAHKTAPLASKFLEELASLQDVSIKN
jgi:FkbM family methyltransferase